MGHMRVQLAAALVLAAALHVCAAPPWTPGAYPNPKHDPDACNPARPGLTGSSICDPDSVLSAGSANRVEGILKEIWDGVDPYVRKQCGPKMEGYQVAVALMRSMAVPPGEPAAAQAQIFARSLHDAWGVGDAACNNGVLLLLSIEDRQAFISTGRGAHEALPDSAAVGVVDAMRPLLRKGRYDEAVEQAVVDIGLGLAGRGGESEGAVDWFAVSFFGVVALLVGNSCRRAWLRRREYRDCQRMLAKLKREQDQVRNHAWSAPTSCPICLEDFNPQPTPRNAPGAEAGAAAEAGPSGSAAGKQAAPAEDSPSTSLLLGNNGGSSSAGEGGEGASDAEACCSGAALGGGAERSGMRRRGGAGRSPSKEGGGAASGPRREPVTLRCGHTFCNPCLTKWLEQKATCPVCRVKVTDDGSQHPPAHAAQQAGSASGDAANANRLLADFWAMELAFRLGSLQRLYPGYVSPAMADQWVAEARETGTFNWEASREFQLRDPGMRAQHEQSGSGGFSTSFGGGSSFGGGGVGGSW